MKNLMLLFLVVVIMCLASCSKDKLVEYQYFNEDIELHAYDYNNDRKPDEYDLVAVICKQDSFKRTRIFKIKEGLQNVAIDNKTIHITFNCLNTYEPVIKKTDSICGYKIEYTEVIACK